MFNFVGVLLRSTAKVSSSIRMIASAVTSEAVAKPEGEPPAKRRRKEFTYALLLAYQGKNYNGMQVQRDFPTIEGALFEALAKAGYISPEDVHSPVQFNFQRAARTDRCVSAVRQMCSLRLSPEDPVKFLQTAVDQINSNLPSEIRVLGIRRAIRSFIAHKFCDKRTYSYTLPTYAFAKMDELTTNRYRIDETGIEELNEILVMYKGTHNFFNYTSGKSFDDRSSNRYIHEFKSGSTQIFKDELRGDLVEFITIYITGQSFMLHQIRKIIAMVIAVARGLCGKNEIAKSFDRDRMDVPKAPGLGLLLEKVHYERYDKWYEKTHEKLNDWGEQIEKVAEDFRQKAIISEIFRQEVDTQSMFLWLTNLIKHDLGVVKEEGEMLPLAMASAQVSLANKKALEDDVESSKDNEKPLNCVLVEQTVTDQLVECEKDATQCEQLTSSSTLDDESKSEIKIENC